MLVSRDAKFMEDVFDIRRRDYCQQDIVIDDAEATDVESHQEEEEKENGEGGTARDADMESSSKRH